MKTHTHLCLNDISFFVLLNIVKKKVTKKTKYLIKC